MCTVLQKNIPSVSMTLASIIIFLFLQSMSFFSFCPLNPLSIPLLSILITCLLLYFSSISFFCHLFSYWSFVFFHPHKYLHVREPIVEVACTDRPMLPVTSDTHNILSASSGCVIIDSFSDVDLSSYYSVLLVLIAIFACVKFDYCRSLCYVCSIACLHV